LIRSSFLNVYASSLILAARYSEGLEIADSELEQAHQFRLAFVLPHACVYRAAALLGLRRFKSCGAALDHAERARRRNDGFLIMNIGAVRARLQLALGSIDEALETFETHHHRLSLVGMEGEFLACWSLALACRGRSREAERKARQAEATTQRAEVAALVPWTRAVTALRIGARDARSLAQQALETAGRIGNLDGFVTAYRAFPPVLDSLASNEKNRKILVATLEQSRDQALARGVGLRIPATTTRQGRDGLSKREQEVLNLLVRGMPNKEIARTLYITEGTVKAHLHHIYEKLGVRSRTEAVLSQADGDKPG
jgi:ATP/maltotriose-dependent transcriptional regulator MalT